MSTHTRLEGKTCPSYLEGEMIRIVVELRRGPYAKPQRGRRIPTAADEDDVHSLKGVGFS